MPEALRVGAAREEGSEGDWSSEERSRVPLGFLVAVLAPAPLGFEGRLASSAARRASRSAFLAAASAALAAAASLAATMSVGPGENSSDPCVAENNCAYFLALDFAPLDHSRSSCCANFA